MKKYYLFHTELQTIAKVVENLPHLKGLDMHLYKLGHRHVKYLSNALKPLYWVAFQVSHFLISHQVELFSGCNAECNNGENEVYY